MGVCESFTFSGILFTLAGFIQNNIRQKSDEAH